MADTRSHLDKWSEVIAKTPYGERQVYTGKNMAGNIFVRSTKGGYAPLVTMRIEHEGLEIVLHLGDGGAEELGKMLLAATAATQS